MLLKVWRTVLDLLKGGRGGRHLISFFKIGIVGCFSKNKSKTSRWKSILKRQIPYEPSTDRITLELGFHLLEPRKLKRINDITDLDMDFQLLLKK